MGGYRCNEGGQSEAAAVETAEASPVMAHVRAAAEGLQQQVQATEAPKEPSARKGGAEAGGSSSRCNSGGTARRGVPGRSGGRGKLTVSVQGSLVVGVLNIDGAYARKAIDVAQLMEQYGLDILILGEVKWYGQLQAEFSAALAAASKAGSPFRVAAARCRTGTGRDGPRAGGHGGVAVITRGDIDVALWSPPLTEEAEREVAAAAAACTDEGDVGAEDVLFLRARRGGTASQFTRIIGVYLSPALPRTQAECRLRRIRHAVEAAIAAGETVVVCGDLNARMGGGTAYLGEGLYRTVDGGTSTHTVAVCEFLAEAGLQPVHGMPQGQRQAQWTNRTAAGGESVVDYILVPTATAVDVVLRAEQSVAGALAPGLSTTHSLLVVEVRGAVAAAAVAAKRRAGLSNKLTEKRLPGVDDVSGVSDAYSARLCRVIAAGVQQGKVLWETARAWVEQNPEARNTSAVWDTVTELYNEASSLNVSRLAVDTLGLNPRVHPVVEKCALGTVPPPGDATARELYDLLRALPVLHWSDVPAPVPKAPPPQGGAARGGEGGGPVQQPAEVAAAVGAAPAPAGVAQDGVGAAAAAAAPSPAPAPRRPIPELTAERGRAESAYRAAQGDTLRFSSEKDRASAGKRLKVHFAAKYAAAQEAEQAALSRLRVADAALVRALRQQRLTSIMLGGGTLSAAVWKRVQAAAVGLRPDGTFDAAEASGRTAGFPDTFISTSGEAVPALRAFADNAREQYGNVGQDGMKAADVGAAYRGKKAAVPIILNAFTAAEVRQVFEGEALKLLEAEEEEEEDVDVDVGVPVEAAAAAPAAADAAAAPSPSLRPTVLKKGKSPGLGGITRELLSCDGDATTTAANREARRELVYESLAQFFSTFLSDRVESLPSAWQMVCIYPIVKAGEPPTSPSAGRYITVQPVWNKLWRLLQLGRTMEWAEANGMLSDTQYGFRQQRGVEDAVFCLLQGLHIQHHIEQKPAYVAFVDFRKAYDMVPRHLLLAKLEAMGVGEDFLRLQRAAFKDTSARIWLNGEVSEAFPIDRGTPQGDPLSPLLFSLFLDDLLQELSSSKGFKGMVLGGSGAASTRAAEHAAALTNLAYADDVSLASDDPEDLQRGLDIVDAWAKKWGMRVNTNVGKTEVMVIPSPADRRATKREVAAGVAPGTPAPQAAVQVAEAALAKARKALDTATAKLNHAEVDVRNVAILKQRLTNRRIAEQNAMKDLAGPVRYDDPYEPLLFGMSQQQWLTIQGMLMEEHACELNEDDMHAQRDTERAATATAQRAVDAATARLTAAIEVVGDVDAAAARAAAEAVGEAQQGLAFHVGGAPVGLAASYSYLGVMMTPDLNMAAALQGRVNHARWQALRWRQLPHSEGGLPASVLSATFTALVQSQLESTAGAWAPPREEGRHFGEYRCAPGVPVTLATMCSKAASLQVGGARHVLSLDDPLRWAGRFGVSTAVVLGELGWTHLPSRWELAQLRVLGNVLRSPRGSIMRCIALRLKSHALTNPEPQPWNWYRTVMRIVDSVDSEARAPRAAAAAAATTTPPLAAWFDAVTLLPRQPEDDGRAAGAVLPQQEVAGWVRGWRAASYNAVNGSDGRDARVWRARLRRDAERYARTTRAAETPVAGTPLAASMHDPGAGVAAAAAAGGAATVECRRGPPACGTTSVMDSITSLSPTWGQRFGRQARQPYLNDGRATESTTARVLLRVGIACSASTMQKLAAADGEGGGAPPGEDEGGCLWGRSKCQLCGCGATADAYHLLAECTYPALEKLRDRAFDTAITRLLRWHREVGQDAHAGAGVGEAVTAAVTALTEAKRREVRHTLPVMSLSYLAALGVPMATGDVPAAAKAAGIPLGWVPLLEIPVGVGRRRQQNTVAARVLAAFAPLALHVAALRNNRGEVAAARDRLARAQKSAVASGDVVETL